MSRKRKASYHHGHLRAALLEAAVDLIGARGLHGLSLRECARRAGVSHAAPYRHFADRDALLHAIAEQGFAWLTEAGRKAMEGIDAPRERLDRYGAAYVRFAYEHPVHHRVMFASELPDKDDATDSGAFDLLLEAAAGLRGPGEDPTLTALASWSLVHGLAMLILDRRIPAGKVETAEDVEALAYELFRQWRGPLA